MKRSLTIGCALVALVGVIGGMTLAMQSLRWLGRGNLAYIEQTTGVTFPPNISEIDVFDNTEFFIVAHVRLQRDDIDSFSAQYGFVPLPLAPMTEASTLSSPNRVIPVTANLGLDGHSASNRWHFVLDQTSGRLWVVVYYPDPGGMLP